MEIATHQQVQMLSEEVAEQLKRFHWRWSFAGVRCLLKNDDHGPQGMNPPIIPYAPFIRSRVYTGTQETGSYNHHSQLVKFKGRYFFAWSNGVVDEEAEGQRILISSSPDAVRWSDAVCVAGDVGSALAHNCVALMAGEDALFIVGMSEECIRDATVTGMRRIDPESTEMCIYSSPDGVTWKKAYSFGDKFKWIFEAPRRTAEGRRMCICATLKGQPAMLCWKGDNLCEDPEVVLIPEPAGAKFPYGEGTWYQIGTGRIVVFWRDEAGSCSLYVNTSDDGGRTFTAPLKSDIPDSMSRVYAGRLQDGRYYVCNNAFPTLLDRRHLLLLLSDDGKMFNKAYVLIDDPTSQRLKGLLKADGYQYPCCLEEKGRLLVAYSVNKEDIECGIVDTTKI